MGGHGPSHVDRCGCRGVLILPACYPPQPGALPPGTAQLTVDDTATANTDAVECTSTSSLIMIRTGDSTGGAMAIVDNASGLDVKSVRTDTVGNQD